MGPKIKVKPTPAQARILRALSDNLGLFIHWNGKGRSAFWSGMNEREIRGALGNPATSTMKKLEYEGWVEEQDPDSDSDKDPYYPIDRSRYWGISNYGSAALRLLQDDDFVSLGPVMTSGDILHILRHDVFPSPYWLFVSEMSLQYWSPRRIDGFALRVAPSVRMGPGYSPGIAFHTARNSWALEVKVSRSDFLAELAHPRKRDPAMAIAHRFAFVTPAGLVKPEEIPEGLGLLEVNSERRVEVRVRPSLMVPDPPDWRLVASLARAMMRNER